MKIFEQEVKKLLSRYSVPEAPEPQSDLDEVARIVVPSGQTKKISRRTVEMQQGLSLEELDQQTEYRRRRSIQQLD